MRTEGFDDKKRDPAPSHLVPRCSLEVDNDYLASTSVSDEGQLIRWRDLKAGPKHKAHLSHKGEEVPQGYEAWFTLSFTPSKGG